MYKKIVDMYGDKSFNYKIGDLRGAISVAIPMTYVYEQNKLFYIMYFILIVLLLAILFSYIFIEKKFITQPALMESIENEVYLETVIESNNNAIIAIDGIGKITTYNKKAEEIFGWTKEEKIGTDNLLRIIPPKYKELHTNASTKYLATGESCGLVDGIHELEGVRKNGEIFPIRISFGATYKPENTIVIANISDRSEEKEQKALGEELEREVAKRTRELEIASRAKSDFLANMSHEIRTPLNGIIGFVDLLYKNEADVKKQEKLQIIKESGNSLLTIINDILDFSKIENNKLLIEKEPYYINELFTHIVALFFSKAKENNISIAIDIDEKLPQRTLGDSTRVKQVFSNLLSNAIKFSNSDSTIIVNVNYLEGTYELYCEVIDSGVGIAADKIDSVFNSWGLTS